uniref:Uncharacterized protein n=1 Tax=Manihot esculenta TaxID=3983 RepID=A0A2C9U329_MANES
MVNWVLNTRVISEYNLSCWPCQTYLCFLTSCHYFRIFYYFMDN